MLCETGEIIFTTIKPIFQLTKSPNNVTPTFWSDKSKNNVSFPSGKINRNDTC
ncbi:Uncharacterised protein [Acinetobacter baumannii]|nr:Uncharacterised protein [Acinetobacter baumannii]